MLLNELLGREDLITLTPQAWQSNLAFPAGSSYPGREEFLGSAIYPAIITLYHLEPDPCVITVASEIEFSATHVLEPDEAVISVSSTAGFLGTFTLEIEENTIVFSSESLTEFNYIQFFDPDEAVITVASTISFDSILEFEPSANTITVSGALADSTTILELETSACVISVNSTTEEDFAVALRYFLTRLFDEGDPYSMRVTTEDVDGLVELIEETIGVGYPTISAENLELVNMNAGIAVCVVSGGVEFADQSEDTITENHAAIGLVIATTPSGETAVIQTQGPLTLANWTNATGSSILTIGKRYWLRETGMILDSPPPTGLLQIVGQASSEDTLVIQPQFVGRRY